MRVVKNVQKKIIAEMNAIFCEDVAPTAEQAEQLAYLISAAQRSGVQFTESLCVTLAYCDDENEETEEFQRRCGEVYGELHGLLIRISNNGL
jgi:hypothetical protein